MTTNIVGVIAGSSVAALSDDTILDVEVVQTYLVYPKDFLAILKELPITVD